MNEFADVERRLIGRIDQQVRLGGDDHGQVDLLPGRLPAPVVPGAQHGEEILLPWPAENAIDLLEGEDDGLLDAVENPRLNQVSGIESRFDRRQLVGRQIESTQQDTQHPLQEGRVVGQLRVAHGLQIDECHPLSGSPAGANVTHQETRLADLARALDHQCLAAARCDAGDRCVGRTLDVVAIIEPEGAGGSQQGGSIDRRPRPQPVRR